MIWPFNQVDWGLWWPQADCFRWGLSQCKWKKKRESFLLLITSACHSYTSTASFANTNIQDTPIHILSFSEHPIHKYLVSSTSLLYTIISLKLDHRVWTSSLLSRPAQCQETTTHLPTLATPPTTIPTHALSVILNNVSHTKSNSLFWSILTDYIEHGFSSRTTHSPSGGQGVTVIQYGVPRDGRGEPRQYEYRNDSHHRWSLILRWLWYLYGSGLISKVMVGIKRRCTCMILGSLGGQWRWFWIYIWR